MSRVLVQILTSKRGSIETVQPWREVVTVTCCLQDFSVNAGPSSRLTVSWRMDWFLDTLQCQKLTINGGKYTVNPHGSPHFVLFQITLTSCDLELFELTPPFRNRYLDFKFQRARVGDGFGSLGTLTSNSLFILSCHHISVTECQELIARSLCWALEWSLSSCPQPTGCSSAHWCLPEKLRFLFHKPNLWTF